MPIRHILGGHTAANLVENIKEILSEFKIGAKLGFFTTDNVNCMIRTVKDLNLERVPCFAHILNLIIKNSLKSIKQHSKSDLDFFDPEVEYDRFADCDDDEENEFDNQNGPQRISAKERLKIAVNMTLTQHASKFKCFDKGNKKSINNN
jgi:hypothetical protein